MKITVSKKDLLRGITRTHAIADRKASMTMLANVLLEVDAGGAIRFSATDSYLSASTSVSPEGAAEGASSGAIALPAKSFFDVVKTLPDAPISLEAQPDHSVHIRFETKSKTSGDSQSDIKLFGMDPADFPRLPAIGEATTYAVDAAALSDLIAKTSYCMSTDETRPWLAGTLLELSEGTLRAVATDGHRLSMSERKLGLEGGFKAIVPSRGVLEIKKLLDEAKAAGSTHVHLAITGEHVFAWRDDTRIAVRLAEGKFPPFSQVIPKKNRFRSIVFDRSKLIESLRRVAVVSGSSAVRVVLDASGMRLSGESISVGSAQEYLAVAHLGGEVKFSLSAKYFADALGAIGCDEVALETNGELDPVVVKPSHGDDVSLAVVMPMRA